MTLIRIAAVSVFSAALLAGGAPTTVPDSKPLDLARQLNEAFVEVADKVSACVVVIEVAEKDSDDDSGATPWHKFFQSPNRPHHWQRHDVEGEGSGVIITDDGYILTNNHVVENADRITVRLHDGRKFTAHIKGADPESDIAVIKIDVTGLPTAVLGDSDKTRVGEFVLAIGAPFDLSYTVTVGHVSAKSRAFNDDNSGYLDQDFIQTDASINPGNSGGPLVNLYGEVIGLNAMIEGMNRGIGFAVPINLARRVKDHLITEGKFVRSWLGIQIQSLREDDEYRDFVQGVSDGVVVRGIEPESPAAASSLKLGDVIVAVDGKPVATARELKDEISGTAAGKTVNLAVVREKTRVTVPVKLAAMPGNEDMAKNNQSATPDSSPESNAFGLTVEALNKETSRKYGLDETLGILVTGVEDGSPADDTGIQEGDIITEVNRKPVLTLRQFREALKAGDPKVGELINLVSKGARKLVVLHDSH
jgi:serine protease Do